MTRYLTRAAKAYATGEPKLGAWLWERAYTEVLPLVRRVVIAKADGSRDVDDAIQLAMLNIWKAVKQGREPAIKVYATTATIDTWRRAVRHEADELDERLAAPDAHDSDEPPPVELVASYAPERWRDISDLAQAGWGQNEIALKLGVAKPTLRRIACEIRDDYHLRRSLAS